MQRVIYESFVFVVCVDCYDYNTILPCLNINNTHIPELDSFSKGSLLGKNEVAHTVHNSTLTREEACAAEGIKP